MTAKLTLPQARRIALAAQGLAKERPTRPVTARQVGRTFARVQLLQIDSVNVLVRSHYLPFFSRLGPYDAAIVDRLAGRAPRRLMEYWAHEACYVRPESFADLRVWQRRQWVGAAGLDPLLRRDLEQRILQVLQSSRPLTARQVAARIGHEEDVPKLEWGWNWNAVKRVLEALFEQGVVSAAGRTAQFERLYAPTARVLPPDQDPLRLPDREEAMLRLVEAAAAAHGIGSVRCLADYFRVPVQAAARAAASLAAQGKLEEVEVQGWPGPRYLHPAAARPRRASGRALLSPFDSLVFERRRLQQLFGFHYRIEIYTPAARRRYGYYVLPFLLGEAVCARVDLKADRAAGLLLVRGAYAEPAAPVETAVELARELDLLAQWLGLGGIAVEDRGGLAPALAAALGERLQRPAAAAELALPEASLP
ncbi:winged helix DNA-binding domain-containing protein [Arthrobacter sp. I2-34]|uniref:Winged helix DNA-binding domain-containing protein n=1 Tax=Arthrobacter hankyongi TaxID=2904801 RepID=A0ABS9L8B4_9MICC|nr:crosslink repair DNA glycosylase YcaQ family protein [Arthrobacter hankyongi]MCG2622732.1 winged helix DNA-binding domain-containing protein [Arthrobacter hankyongi]